MKKKGSQSPTFSAIIEGARVAIEFASCMLGSARAKGAGPLHLKRLTEPAGASVIEEIAQLIVAQDWASVPGLRRFTGVAGEDSGILPNLAHEWVLMTATLGIIRRTEVLGMAPSVFIALSQGHFPEVLARIGEIIAAQPVVPEAVRPRQLFRAERALGSVPTSTLEAEVGQRRADERLGEAERHYKVMKGGPCEAEAYDALCAAANDAGRFTAATRTRRVRLG